MPKEDTQFKPGKSGNPKGRPEGSRNKASLIAEQLMGGATEQVVKAVVKQAKQGDMQAARIILDRLCPPRKGRPVAIDLPEVQYHRRRCHGGAPARAYRGF